MNVVPAQVAGVDVARGGQPAAEGDGGLPDARDPGRVRAARRRRGLRGRRRPGDRDVRLRRPRTALRAGRHDHRARATSRSPPPSGCCAAWSASTPRPGPTEIAILADDTADPVHVAADLISQAEHDPLAASVLVTASRGAGRRGRGGAGPAGARATKHAERVTDGADRPAVRHRAGRRPRAGPAGRRRVRGRAPGDPDPRRARPWPRGSATPARSSSGAWSPVSLGDYCAGSNHVLPTGGCARHSSGLSVQTFLRGVHVIEYDEEALREVAGHVVDAGRRRGPARARRTR